MTTIHATALALIEERLALVEAGTPGPWSVGRFFWKVGSTRGMPDEWWLSVENPTGEIIACNAEEAPPSLPNATLIAQMHADYAPLLMLARDVLVRHHVSPGTDHCDLCWDGPRRGIQSRESWWPCPDARAALRSVGLVTE